MTVTVVQTVLTPTAVIPPSTSIPVPLRRHPKPIPSLPQPPPSPPLTHPTPPPSCPTSLTSTRPLPNQFSWSSHSEPHLLRRRQILTAHPEIRELFGVEPLTFPLVVLLFLTQLTAAYLLRAACWPLLLLCTYALSGTLNHSLQLAVHELTHNLCFTSATANRCAAICANLSTGIPSAVSFQKYHHDHHQWQGVDGVDTDVPTAIESRLFATPLGKLAWLLLNPLFYAFRPGMVNPKSFGRWEAINFAVVLSFDLLVLCTLGVKSLAYLGLGTLLGLGLHPAAGHFIAEHYELVSGQETYSYYGPANWLNFNVGYHNEHHDFPRVPWSRLPRVTALAPEYYLTLPHYTSYLALFWAYITDASLGPHARIKRAKVEGLRKVAEGERRREGKVWIGLLLLMVSCLLALGVGSLC